MRTVETAKRLFKEFIEPHRLKVFHPFGTVVADEDVRKKCITEGSVFIYFLLK